MNAKDIKDAKMIQIYPSSTKYPTYSQASSFTRNPFVNPLRYADGKEANIEKYMPFFKFRINL